MNFMSGTPGFCEEITGTAGMPSSSSSSSASSSPSSTSLQHKGLPRYSYHHQHQEAYGGGRASQLPDSSPTTNGGGGDDDSDDHMLVRRGGEGSSAGEAHVVIEREHMFDKVVTPSDVGKLNRLVIPKQHAEKYFPLDSSANGKGLLLNFEDRNGKSWWFRYSYWNSSQSYVMTKGWSRFVKDKKLDAGDTVSFQRGVGELGKDRLFIDWRRRTDAAELPHPIPTLSIPHQFSFHGPVHPWNPLFLQPPSRDYSNFLIQANSSISTQHHHYRSRHHYPTGYCPYAQNSVVNGNTCTPGSTVYPRSARGVGIRAGPGVCGQEQAVDLIHAQGRSGVGVEQMVIESIPVVQGKATAKRFRLFGVNMDCPISESDECDRLSSTSPPQGSVMPTIQHLPPAPFNSSHSAVNPNFPELRPYNDNDDKGKDSVSLDLDM